jgi:hypothetical protein
VARRAAFHTLEDADELRELATTLKETLGRLNAALDSPPYNLVLHTAPLADPDRALLPLAPGDHARASRASPGSRSARASTSTPRRPRTPRSSCATWARARSPDRSASEP